MLKQILVLVLLLAIISLVGCESKNEENTNPFGSEDIVWDNSKIKPKDLSIKNVRETMSTYYDRVRLEITNNSKYPLHMNGAFRLYEKTEEGYILIDDKTVINNKTEDSWVVTSWIIEAGKKGTEHYYLGSILEDGFTKAGEYKIEVPINEDFTYSSEFKIVEGDITFDSEIEIVFPKNKFAIDSEEYFSYTIFNNSETDLGVSLSLIISKYENGEWVRLPITQKYDEVNYPNAASQQLLPAKGKVEQNFYSSLADIIKTELTPGKYRLEKRVYWDWYFVEFEMH